MSSETRVYLGERKPWFGGGRERERFLEAGSSSWAALLFPVSAPPPQAWLTLSLVISGLAPLSEAGCRKGSGPALL